MSLRMVLKYKMKIMYLHINLKSLGLMKNHIEISNKISVFRNNGNVRIIDLSKLFSNFKQI